MPEVSSASAPALPGANALTSAASSVGTERIASALARLWRTEAKDEIRNMPLAEVVDLLLEAHGRRAVKMAVTAATSRRERTSIYAHGALWAIVETTKAAMGHRATSKACEDLSAMMLLKHRISGDAIRHAYLRAERALRKAPDHAASALLHRDKLLELWQASGSDFTVYGKKLVSGWISSMSAREAAGKPPHRIWPKPNLRRR